MSRGIIELNDASMGLGLNGELLSTSAGYAVLDQKNLMVGNDAIQNVKLLPRWTNNRFWHQLNTDGLSNATAAIRHHADLAFAHLEQLKQQMECNEIIIAVPGHYDKNQLGLLLGMCKEAGLPVRALVDLALLSVAGQPSHSTAVYLDVGLHSITLSTLSSDGVLRKTGHTTLIETGLATYWDRWASLIAEQFIQSSRFDPMHEAASEQRLFNALPGFMSSVGDSRALNFELNLGSVTHSTALSKDQLLGATASAYPTIVQGIRQSVPSGRDFTLFVSSRLEHFPELMTSLKLIPEADIVHIPPAKIVENSEALWSSLVSGSEAVSHVTTLAANKAPATVSSTQGEVQPTHLLVGDNAYALRNVRDISGFDGDLAQQPGTASVGRDGGRFSLLISNPAMTINGESGITQHSLRVGDQLEINGKSARVIAER